MPVEIFKTNIEDLAAVNIAVGSLVQQWPDWKINIDLDDCDKILRIESVSNINTAMVSHHLTDIGFFAEVLE